MLEAGDEMFRVDGDVDKDVEDRDGARVDWDEAAVEAKDSSVQRLWERRESRWKGGRWRQGVRVSRIRPTARMWGKK